MTVGGNLGYRREKRGEAGESVFRERHGWLMRAESNGVLKK